MSVCSSQCLSGSHSCTPLASIPSVQPQYTFMCCFFFRTLSHFPSSIHSCHLMDSSSSFKSHHSISALLLNKASGLCRLVYSTCEGPCGSLWNSPPGILEFLCFPPRLRGGEALHRSGLALTWALFVKCRKLGSMLHPRGSSLCQIPLWSLAAEILDLNHLGSLNHSMKQKANKLSQHTQPERSELFGELSHWDGKVC